jgi:hypothetical protein
VKPHRPTFKNTYSQVEHQPNIILPDNPLGSSDALARQKLFFAVAIQKLMQIWAI